MYIQSIPSLEKKKKKREIAAFQTLLFLFPSHINIFQKMEENRTQNKETNYHLWFENQCDLNHAIQGFIQSTLKTALTTSGAFGLVPLNEIMGALTSMLECSEDNIPLENAPKAYGVCCCWDKNC